MSLKNRSLVPMKSVHAASAELPTSRHSRRMAAVYVMYFRFWKVLFHRRTSSPTPPHNPPTARYRLPIVFTPWRRLQRWRRPTL